MNIDSMMLQQGKKYRYKDYLDMIDNSALSRTEISLLLAIIQILLWHFEYWSCRYYFNVDVIIINVISNLILSLKNKKTV